MPKLADSKVITMGLVGTYLGLFIGDSLLLYDPTVAIVDRMPIPVCQFARAYRCHRFDDTASTGCDHTCRQTFYGFRLSITISSGLLGNVSNMAAIFQGWLSYGEKREGSTS